jgi:uncharacterized protein
MIIDALTYLGRSRFGWDVTPRALLLALEGAEVDAAVVAPCQPGDHAYDRANEAVGEAVQETPTRLIGLARVDPLQGESALAELSRAQTELGLTGLLLHPWEDSFPLTHPMVEPLLAEAERLRFPVTVATGYPWVAEASQLQRVAERHPNLTLLATNGAQVNISGLGQVEAESLVSSTENVLLLTNGVYRDDFLAQIGERYGAARLAFASSFPLMNLPYEKQRVERSEVAKQGLAEILGGTIASIYGFRGERQGKIESKAERAAR